MSHKQATISLFGFPTDFTVHQVTELCYSLENNAYTEGQPGPWHELAKFYARYQLAYFKCFTPLR